MLDTTGHPCHFRYTYVISNYFYCPDIPDLDGAGLTESLFIDHKDMYIEYEQASLRQLYKAKVFLKHSR